MEFCKQDYERIYEWMHVGPLGQKDCGQACQSSCCRSYPHDMGIYLLPGEEKMFSSADASWLTWEIHDPLAYDFPPSWTQPVYYAKCNGWCPRDKRPIQCRTFPLTPHVEKNGRLLLIWETLQLPYQCPLIINKTTLNREYIEGMYRGWTKLLENVLIYDLIHYDSLQRTRDRSLLFPYPLNILR